MIVDPLILIPCAKTSMPVRCAAKIMYFPSIYFQKVWKYAHLMGEAVMILSSKYGLLHPETEIEPYDEYLSTHAKAKQWASRVFPDLIRLIQWCGFTRVVFLTGQKYSQYLKWWLIDLIENRNVMYQDPLQGLGIGQRLQWLTQRITNEEVGITCESCGAEAFLYFKDFQELMWSDAAIECYNCRECNDFEEEF